MDLAEKIQRFLRESVTPIAVPLQLEHPERMPRKLKTIYELYNGFYAYKGALLFRPWDQSHDPLGVVQWNKVPLWKQLYPDEISIYTFFSEDIFGYQFGFRDDSEQIYRLDPETGDIELFATCTEEMLLSVIDDPGEHTGDVFVDLVEKRGQKVFAGERLIPKTPFVCDGDFSPDNFMIVSDLHGMKIRAQLASKLRDIPDGSKVVFRLE